MSRLGLVSVLMGGSIALTALAWMTVWTPHHSVRGDLWLLAAGGALAGYAVGVAGSRREGGAAAEAGRRRARQGRRLNGLLAAGLVVGAGASALASARVPRISNAVIGDVRSVLSAQAHYQRETGAYGELRCLEEPPECIPGYPTSGPAFLDAELASLQAKQRYERAFSLGPAGEPASSAGGAPGSSGFAYVAVPSEALREQGPYPGFCGDASGAVCSTPDGSAPQVEDGRCVLSAGPVPRPAMLERLGRWSGLLAPPAPGSCYRIG